MRIAVTRSTYPRSSKSSRSKAWPCAHCRTQCRQTQAAGQSLTMQCQDFAKLAADTPSTAVLVAAARALIRQGMTVRDDLRHRRNFAAAQAAAAYDEIAQPIEQSVVHFAFSCRSHEALQIRASVLTLHNGDDQQTALERLKTVNQSWFWM